MRKGGQARWTGPGVVVGPEKGNWWVSMNGQFLKAAPQQIRQASEEELQAHRHVDEVLMQFDAKQVAADGGIDLTQQEFPPGQIPADAAPNPEEPEPRNPEVEKDAPMENSAAEGEPARRVMFRSTKDEVEKILRSLEKTRNSTREELLVFNDLHPRVEVLGARLVKKIHF